MVILETSENMVLALSECSKVNRKAETLKDSLGEVLTGGQITKAEVSSYF